MFLLLCWVSIAEHGIPLSGGWRLLFAVVHGPLTVVASPAAERRLEARGLQQLPRMGSLSSGSSQALECELRSCSVCGIFLDQGWSPYPLHL